ncbi:MAG: glycoside hydrolase family 3 protein [Spirochaetaceae bacterium]|nr:glycoside hydrolase family 3 protein [Spirochaetaceae bacterium]
MSVDVKAAPFNLGAEDAAWVDRTLKAMSLEEKVGQIFFLEGMMTGGKKLNDIITRYGPGGIMYRQGLTKIIAREQRRLQALSKIPLFLAANLEAGGNGLVSDGTFYGNNMTVGATKDGENARRLGEICAREAGAVGGNMAFAPVIDLNLNWRNPITNTRSFGDDPELVARMGAAYVKGAMDNGCSVTIKHFPGDGCDGRDQHCLTTVNTLSVEDWMASYGAAYKACIAAGADGLMVGHIAFPAYCDRHGKPELRDLPGTLNPLLLQKLLREELGFKGLTMTDATMMTGFLQAMPRREVVPLSIAAGCDMFLFQRNMDEDFRFMMDGIKDGVLTVERVDEAVTRILATKAARGLHRKSLDELVPGSIPEELLARHKAWAVELADKAVTLVKDEQSLLPLDPARKPKIAYIKLGSDADMMDLFKKLKGWKGAALRLAMKASALVKKPEPKTMDYFARRLGAEGFVVESVDFSDIFAVFKTLGAPIEDFKAKYDVVIYASNTPPQSNSSSLLIQYDGMLGLGAPWMVREVPTMFVSFASPYHQYDVPMIKTFVNAYSANHAIVDQLVDKLLGRSAFKGSSPVKLTSEEFRGVVG